MQILGIDYGDSRIGVAKSDAMGWLAQGLETIKNNGGNRKPIERIAEIVKQYEIKIIVVGYPKNMNGTEGPKALKVQEFIDQLALALPEAKIVKWDERLTTVAAQRTMTELNIKTSKKKSIVDQIAAVYILQGYLDSIANR